MPGGFPFDYDVCGCIDYGTNLANSAASVITSGAANTKGAYSIIGTTTRDISLLTINGWGAFLTGAVGAQSFSVDIAIGAAGSEKIIIPDIVLSGADTLNVMGLLLYLTLPISIPAGKIISARCQSTVAGDQLTVLAHGYEGSFVQMEGIAGYDCLGFNSATTLGVQTDSGGTGHTKSAYTTVIAATARDYMGFCVAFDTAGYAGASSINSRLIDIAIGAGGAEIPIISNIEMVSWGASAGAGFTWLNDPRVLPFLPIQIPAGTRISARHQSSTTTAGRRTLGYTILAGYQ